MLYSTRFVSLPVAVLLLLALCGCPPPSGSNDDPAGNTAQPGQGNAAGQAPASGAVDGQPGQATDLSAYYDGDNVNFDRINIGLNGQALDLISDTAPLCGAKQASVFFFGDANRNETGIYKRDLVRGSRELLTTVKQMVPESLNCSNDGRFLAYAKHRNINVVIDKPEFEYPEFVAELYRLDTSSGEEVKLFNFGTEFPMYRNDSLFPFISEDGNRIVCLSYDIHRLLLQTQCIEWLRLYEEINAGRAEATEEQRMSDDDNMRVFLRADHVAPKLREMGFDPTAETPIDDAARQAVRDLFEKFQNPIMALLVWENGEARAQILTPAPGQERSLHFILAVSDDTILMGAKEPSADPTEPQQIYSVDLDSGVLSPFGSYQGAPSLIEFDGRGENLIVAYNPFDRANKRIDTETFIKVIPVDGSAASERRLNADYFGYLDLNSDASILVGQNRDDLWLYRVDTITGEATKLSQHFIDLDGLYLDGPGERAVYIENGISFVTPVLSNPQASEDWISESYFADYRDKVVQFITDAGFELRDDLVLRFEERTGMGVSETSIELSFENNPEDTVLFRYDNNDKTFRSMWSPVPGTLKLKPEYRNSDMDYFDCEDEVEGMLDRLGWQNPNTRESWYPGASPLYDGKTDTYIVTFRDGYWYDPAVQEHWVFNSEATVRVVASTGDIAEINYRAYEQIHDQPIQEDVSKADFQIRNYGNEPIPPDAPVRFDFDDVRLLIVEKKPEMITPGDYRSQVVERIVYEVHAYIQPEDELVLGSLVDAETFEVLGRVNYMPQGLRNPNAPAAGGAAPPPAEGL